MFMTYISEHFHKTSKILEDPETALNTCSKLYAYLSYMHKLYAYLFIYVC
jgi:hypothetical protein